MNSNNRITRFAAQTAAGGTERPMSKVVRAGDFVYVSGQVPTVDGEVIDGGFIAQTEQVFDNLTEALALAECGLEHVIKVNAWLDDARDFASFNGVFKKYFAQFPPARSTVESKLMIDAKVEIEVIAYHPLDSA